jgi:CelD/BcsL family acetyltransferase involved in cellulose biosynthesis
VGSRVLPIATVAPVLDDRRASVSSERGGARYRAATCTAAELVSLAGEMQDVTEQSAFSSPFWLEPLVETMGNGARGHMFGVAVRSQTDGTLAGAFPLAVTREHGCDTVRFAEFGVTDYTAPIFGPAFPKTADEARQFHDAVRVALSGYDLIRFERLLPDLKAYPALPAIYSGAVPSRAIGNVIVILDSVQSYVADLGRKFRKEVDRCRRHIAATGPLVLERAAGEERIAAAFGWLEQLQSQRWEETGANYRLDEPAYAQFYRAVIARGIPAGFAEVITLSAGGTLVGAVFGVRSGDRFIVLRIASDDAQWGRFSPGRITLLAVMESLVAEGVRTFDLGIGDYQFKRRLGADTFGLVDLTAPLTWKGAVVAAGISVKRQLARQPALKRLADRLRGRG